jgi:two-component system sensor histidine kinase UhpB
VSYYFHSGVPELLLETMSEKKIQDNSDAHSNEPSVQKEILQKILDHIPVMISQIDKHGRFCLINRECERRLGWTLPGIEEQGRDALVEFYPDPADRQAVRDFLNDARGEWACFRPTLRDGTVLETSWIAFRLSDGSSLIIGQDLTERKRFDYALRESEQRFRQLAENIGEVFWMRSLGNKVLYTSPAYESVWGRPREHLNGNLEPLLETIHPDDRKLFRQVLQQPGREFNIEYRVVRPDGSLRWIRDRGFPIRDESGKIYRVAGIAEDITDRKRSDQRLKANADLLRALSARVLTTREEERTRIAREIHDELGSCLTGLRWELDALEKILLEAGDNPRCAVSREKVGAMIALADSAVNTLKRIASDLRPSILDDLGLPEALEWQAQQFENRTGIICRVCGLREGVSLNPEQATAAFRIVQEALTNVLRHAQATCVDIVMTQNSAHFVLTISDNGHGMTDGDQSGSQSLGLLGMQERAHLVGGTIEITSAIPQGTQIILRIAL